MFVCVVLRGEESTATLPKAGLLAQIHTAIIELALQLVARELNHMPASSGGVEISKQRSVSHLSAEALLRTWQSVKLRQKAATAGPAPLAR